MELPTISDRDQLIDLFARLVYATPPEFIDFSEIDIDLGDEMIVDGNPETMWYDGCKLTLIDDSTYVIRIPVKRKASVYEYHADKMDDEIKDAESRAEELRLMQKMYRQIANSERRRKNADGNSE